MADKETSAIYVELDALLDTRLGTIARINEDAAVETLKASYHEREEDVFPHVDMDVYKELYAKRDTITLAHSRPTALLVSLARMSAVLAEQAIMQPFQDGATIVVNTFPYQLTDEEKDTIGRAIAAWMKGFAPVELTSIPPESLTPLHCKQQYAMMIVYDYQNWMETHSKAFEATLMPEVVLLGPAIYFNRKPTEEELAREIREAAHPMRAIQQLASPLVQLRLIEVKYFSVIANK